MLAIFFTIYLLVDVDIKFKTTSTKPIINFMFFSLIYCKYRLL
jgi:hypothetical protein